MQPLTTNQISNVILSLRHRADDMIRFASMIEGQYDFYMKQYEEIAYLVDYFEKIRDRIIESENFSARISCTL